ncbi:hypothetical protein [Streptomyces sp. NPDC052701]|uniref:hypothetical protein n=1 Tax=Streptomyces sp. NPDC052701 TaxID=3155533 RepID=UPI003432CEBF
MTSEPYIIVHPPDDRGLREVTTLERTLGRAFSARDLHRLLHRAGFSGEIDIEDPTRVHWSGGDSSVWPDHRWRRRSVAAAMTVGLLINASVFAKIGVKDVFRALSYGGRVTGVSFLAAALVQLVALLSILDYWRKRNLRYSGAAVLIGVIATLVLNSLMLFVHIYGGEYTIYLWLWPTLLIWSFWALWELFRQGVWGQIPHLKGITAGVTASGLLAAVNLAYTQVYLPYAHTVPFPLEVKFGKPSLSSDGTALNLPIHMHYENSAKVRIYVLDAIWHIYGGSTKFVSGARSMKDWKADLMQGSDFRRNFEERDWDLIDFGGLAGVGDWLEPGGKYNHERLVQLPANANFDIISARIEFMIVRADRGTLDWRFTDSRELSWDPEADNFDHKEDAPEWVAGVDDEYIKYHSRIYYSNEILNVTRRPQYVTLWQVIPDFSHRSPPEQDDTDPYMMSIIAPAGRENKYNVPDQQKVSERFGLSSVHSDSAAQASFESLLQTAKRN